MPVVPVDHLAVFVAAVSNIVLGFLWYGPLFGKQWIAMMGFSKKDMEEAKKKGMAKQMILAFLGGLVMAYVLEHSLVFASDYLGISGVMAGVHAGFWNWLGFIMPVTLGTVLWEGKSWSLWMLNTGYYLVALVLMGIVLAVM